MSVPYAQLSVVEHELLRRMIRERFGLDYPPHRRRLLAERLRRRLAAGGLRSYSDYYRLLRYTPEDGAEWYELAEAVTNNETYFFREPYQFEQLVAALPALVRRRRGLRVLSAGCSSGEEVYSLASVLATHRHALPNGFTVHGVDISRARLREAGEGRYTDRSFREQQAPPSGVELERFIQRGSDGVWAVHRRLRERVSFGWRNLAQPEGEELRGFDAVFCRNVLIYVDEADLPRFFDTLAQALIPGGYIFLGHSESLFGRASPFAPIRIGAQFAYQRAP